MRFVGHILCGLGRGIGYGLSRVIMSIFSKRV